MCYMLFEMGVFQLNQMRAIPLLEMGQLFEMGAVQLYDMCCTLALTGSFS